MFVLDGDDLSLGNLLQVEALAHFHQQSESGMVFLHGHTQG